MTFSTAGPVESVADLLAGCAGRTDLGELDASRFWRMSSEPVTFTSSAGARRDGVALQAFWRHRMTMIASDETILVFQSGVILGRADYSPETWRALRDDHDWARLEIVPHGRKLAASDRA